jgi:hypothetical protein
VIEEPVRGGQLGIAPTASGNRHEGSRGWGAAADAGPSMRASNSDRTGAPQVCTAPQTKHGRQLQSRGTHMQKTPPTPQSKQPSTTTGVKRCARVHGRRSLHAWAVGRWRRTAHMGPLTHDSRLEARAHAKKTKFERETHKMVSSGWQPKRTHPDHPNPEPARTKPCMRMAKQRAS